MSIDDAVTALAKNSTAVLGFTIVLPTVLMTLVIAGVLWIEYETTKPVLHKLTAILEHISQCAPSPSSPPP